MTAIQEASIKLPAEERMCTSARMDHTFFEASRQRDSVSRAEERRIVFSRRRERRVSESEGREGSTWGESMGENCVVIVKMPSRGWVGRGETTVAEMWVCILVGYQ